MKFSPSIPNQVVTHQLKGDILYTQEQWEDALASFQNSLDLNPEVPFAIHPHQRKASILVQLGQHQDALSACNYALSLYPGQPALHELKSQILALLS